MYGVTYGFGDKMHGGGSKPWKPKCSQWIARLAASVTGDPAFCRIEESARFLEMLWGRPRVLGCMHIKYSTG